MTPPATGTAPTRRLVLVAAEPRRNEAAVRRFRLARLRLDGRELARAERVDQARRS